MVDDQLRVQDVRDLHAFMLACQLRSLSAVAKQIGESVATVSRRISRLESAVDVALLHRSSRGIEPTEDGVAYRGRIAQVLELLGAANAATGRTAEAPAGTLRVSIPPGLTDVLAPVLADFLEIEDDRLVHVLPAYQWPTGGLYLLHRGGTYVAPKVRAFIAHAKRALARH